MSGTLVVQNIQGPSSGVNANKIIIPSGQTLDIAAWTPPAGTVVQVSNATLTTAFSTAATGWVDVTSFAVTITPKYVGSKILIQLNGRFASTASSDNAIRLLLNGTDAINLVDGIGGLGNLFYAVSGNSPYNDASFSAEWTTASTSAHTFQVQIQRNNGTLRWGTRADGNNLRYSTIYAMEIAG